MWWRNRQQAAQPPASPFQIEKVGQEWLHCDCCGGKTSKLWGWLHQGEATLLAYFVRWSDSHPEKGADFDLLIGPWGEGTTPDDRCCVSLSLFQQENGEPAFMVVNARSAFYGPDKLAAHGLAREDVIGTDFAPYVFDMLDQLWLQDDRLPFLA
jgi:hypothetical protein